MTNNIRFHYIFSDKYTAYIDTIRSSVAAHFTFLSITKAADNSVNFSRCQPDGTTKNALFIYVTCIIKS